MSVHSGSWSRTLLSVSNSETILGTSCAVFVDLFVENYSRLLNVELEV